MKVRTPTVGALLVAVAVGNGRTGAMVWNANGLTMQTSGVDLAQQSTYAAGLVNLSTSPQLDSGQSTYQQRLSLYDGTLKTRYDNNRTVTVMGAPNSEVMGIHVEDSRPNVSSVQLNLNLWDMNSVQNIADVPNLTTWRTIGGVSMEGGKGTLFGALCGVIVLGLINNILTLAGVSAQWIQAIYGLIILVALMLARLTTGKAQD
jgi:hypothetical protein